MIIKDIFLYFLITITISINLYSQNYEAKLVGTESLPIPDNGWVNWSVCGINDRGQVYGRYQEHKLFESTKDLIYLFDSKDGIVILEDGERQFYSYQSVFNNKGQIIGKWNGNPNIFLYSKALGIRTLDFCEIFDKYKTKNDGNNFITPIAFNDLGQLVVTYYMHSTGSKPLLWDNGVIYEMGVSTEFAKNFEALGYHIMDLQLSSINNNGELAGYFCYGKFNEKRNEYVKAGYKAFFWNGETHVIDLHSSINPPQVLKVNNQGVVLLIGYVWDSNYEKDTEVTLLWEVNTGLKSLVNFHGIDINDSSTVLGFLKEHKCCCCDSHDIPAIWKDDHFITIAELLGVKDIEHMAPPFSDEYLIEKLDSFVRINNHGQIACMSTLWGEQHPCILNPTNK